MAAPASAQLDLPTDLEDCTGPGADFCFDGTPALIDSGCGALFEGYAGRIAWPVLRNVGPVTIAVRTRYTFTGQTILPLYVEVASRRGDPNLGCTTLRPGQVVLVAQGAEQCGGTWQSIGPIDLTRYGVPFGEPYHVQCVFFRTTPDRITIRSAGFACIRLISHPLAIQPASWGVVKRLYE
jgi:hypothetical protein